MLTTPPPRRPRDRQPAASSLVIRNIVVNGHRTSVRLEPLMWEALNEIARQRQISRNDLITAIDAQRTTSSLTAAIRIYIVDFYRSLAVRAGWRACQVEAPGVQA